MFELVCIEDGVLVVWHDVTLDGDDVLEREVANGIVRPVVPLGPMIAVYERVPSR